MDEKYIVIDNFLSKKHFTKIKNIFLHTLKWDYNSTIVRDDKLDGDYALDNYKFTHVFYHSNPFMISEDIPLVLPIFDELNISKLYRCQSNFYSRTDKIIHHDYHVDMEEIDHLVALYYVNSNNGSTIIKDIVEVESIENRLLIFDGSLEHASTTASDNIRVNININFQNSLKSKSLKKSNSFFYL